MKYESEDTRSQSEQANTKSNFICEENNEMKVRNRDEWQEQGKLNKFLFKCGKIRSFSKYNRRIYF